MEWVSGLDAELIGADCDDVLGRARLAAMLGEIGEGLAYCVECSEGLAIVRLTKAGRLHCVAVAPYGAMPEGPISESELFARPWPSDWRTKRKDARAIPKDAKGYELGGFACILMEGRSVALGLVTRLSEGGELEKLLLMPGGAEIAPSETGARRIWPFHRWQAGAALLWAKQKGRIVHNYQLACIQASNLDRKAKGLPARNGKKAKKVKGPAKRPLTGPKSPIR
jgi:hypothetical protein